MPRNWFLRVLQMALLAFVGATAGASAIGLLTGLIAPSAEVLAGSPFRSFAIPGLALLVVMGGAGLGAAWLMLRGHPRGSQASVVAAAIIIAFGIVEIVVIGSPPGVARNLQIFYITLGLLIGAVGIALWWGERQDDSGQ